MPLFRRILVANRGEIALRVIRTAQEMGIETVAVFSDADRMALHVRKASFAARLGGSTPAESYLDADKVLAVAKKFECDALHPGYGFLSENAAFSRACAEAGIEFLGPSGDAIASMGDKVAARNIALQAGVPLVPGLQDDVDEDHLVAAAKEVGYPVMLKAAAGGGGKGIRIVEDESGLLEAFRMARAEAKGAFGDDRVYLEKFVLEPRHVEIQIMADKHGNVVHYGERECSVQRRHQKLVEETPSPYMTDKLREAMGEAAIKAAEAVKYEGVGTVEFLVDANRDFYFMEMNTRIQVEHTITEEVIDYDLIKEQIKLAAGEKISGRNHFPKLHSIQCRINAEDPDRNWAPSPGRIKDYHAPGGHGVRVDTHAYAGYMIPPHYDSMISKLIVVAQTREEAITKMQRALDEYIIEGVKTTIPFHQRLMKNQRFRDGDFTTKFLEEENV